MPERSKNCFTIISWNVCLGVQQKLHHVEKLLKETDAAVLFVQECDLFQYQTDAISIKDYVTEFALIEHSKKIRSMAFIKKTIKYKRRKDLEGKDSNIILLQKKEDNIAKKANKD